MPSSTIEYPVDRIINEYNTDEEGFSDLIHSVFDDDFSCNHCAINAEHAHQECSEEVDKCLKFCYLNINFCLKKFIKFFNP